MSCLKPGSDRCKQLAKLHGVEWSAKLEEEYNEKIRNYIKEQLHISRDLLQEDRRCKELGDMLFYYLMSDVEPDENTQVIIRRIWGPLIETESEWYELCCWVLYTKVFFRVYIQLGQTPSGLTYLLYKHPRLMLNSQSHLLMHRLTETLPFASLHENLVHNKDKNGWTHMFHAGGPTVNQYVKLYYDHFDGLLQLLGIQDTKKRTALHVNAGHITDLLKHTYKPRYRSAVADLLSMRDETDKIALEITDDNVAKKKLLWLTEQVQNNRYIQYDRPIILISYTTHKRRNAKEEAEAIYNAFNSRADLFSAVLEKDKTEEELLELINECATREHIFKDQSHSSLIVILMAHGSIGFIEDGEGNPMKVKSIEEAMCKTEALKERPKVLITQCCQAACNIEKTQPYVPTSPHFCAIMSSVPGQRSERGVFLTKFAEQIERCRENETIQQLVRRVCAQMEDENHPQTPLIMGTLKAEFCPANTPFPMPP